MQIQPFDHLAALMGLITVISYLSIKVFHSVDQYLTDHQLNDIANIHNVSY